MADPGDVFRRAFSWLPAQFASQSSEPVGPRQFGSTEHLSTEAIAAFVDGELRMTAHLRAAHHLSLCPECSAEVDAQGLNKVLPAGVGDGQVRELVAALKADGYEGFFSIEPHLGDFDAFGGLCGPDLWTDAYTALTNIYKEQGISWE